LSHNEISVDVDFCMHLHSSWISSDWNINLLIDTPNQNALINLLVSNNLVNTVIYPTRVTLSSSTLIDVMITNKIFLSLGPQSDGNGIFRSLCCCYKCIHKLVLHHKYYRKKVLFSKKVLLCLNASYHVNYGQMFIFNRT
jgi:hypothetical protein